MTIPPQGPNDKGWDIDVVIPPNDTLLSIELLPAEGTVLNLGVDQGVDEINLVLGAEGPRGPTGPPGTAVLQAPNGSLWRLVVSNTGALSTTPA